MSEHNKVLANVRPRRVSKHEMVCRSGIGGYRLEAGPGQRFGRPCEEVKQPGSSVDLAVNGNTNTSPHSSGRE